jgi:predicted  nucleic acid-binding Zn-ribbon protein
MNDYSLIQGSRQRSLFQTDTSLAPTTTDPTSCDIVSVGRRRDGGTRYWCLTHKADATAKYGVPAEQCKGHRTAAADDGEIFTLDLDLYPGGIALWGAVPPVYDTTELGIDRGIHVHARPAQGGAKSIDRSYRRLRVIGKHLEEPGIIISELEAIYYMASSVFEYPMSQIACTYCGHLHLDKDFFSVHPHRRHLCSNCGRHFQDFQKGIGNPICGIREACQVSSRPPISADRPLNIRQEDYSGGIQIWGTNPSFLWTGEAAEEDGIHVHAFSELGASATIDETYSEVIVDGITLDPVMVRVLMAQKALPSLKDRVKSLSCPACGNNQFDRGPAAHTPQAIRPCSSCSTEINASGSIRNVVSNPLVGILDRIVPAAPRPAQKHELDLEPETL